MTRPVRVSSPRPSRPWRSAILTWEIWPPATNLSETELRLIKEIEQVRADLSKEISKFGWNSRWSWPTVYRLAEMELSVLADSVQYHFVAAVAGLAGQWISCWFKLFIFGSSTFRVEFAR